MAYRDDVGATLQQMTIDLRRMREKLEELIAAPADNVRPHLRDVLDALHLVRSDVQSSELHAGQVAVRVPGEWRVQQDMADAGNPVFRQAAGFTPRIPSDAEKESETRAVKATEPAVAQVDDYTRVVKRRECNCGRDRAMVPSGMKLEHARDCPMHPDNLERTLRETGALPDAVPGTNFNRAAPRPSDKHYLP